ncbi:MAG TPA: Ppx/GppA phosphatase family protein [Mariprofundaceae bacterium]|nr:Ppx/GppA phosphatase family protein [Mariprofundaceae bacterium]
MPGPRAAVDIGSNTLRLLIAEPSAQPGTPWHDVHRAHRIVRLGEGLHASGRLSEPGMARALAALQEFAQLITAHDARLDQTHAVATAAMREAENGREFRDRIEAETGIRVQIIDGETEARLSLAGAMAVLHADTRADMLLFDIGGGSTEFIRVRGEALVDAVSRRLGVVRLVEAHLRSDPPSAEDYRAMVRTAGMHLDAVADGWPDGKPPRHLVGTAGTVTTLAAVHLDLYPYDIARINNLGMSRVEFTALRDRLLAMNHAERQGVRTIEPGRADLIVAGLAIIDAILERWHYPELIVVDAGLLEGAWLKAPSSPYDAL